MRESRGVRGGTQVRGGRKVKIRGKDKRATDKKREGEREMGGTGRRIEYVQRKDRGREGAGEIRWGEWEMGDWRAAGEMNGGQASEGPPLSGQCVCACVGVLTMFASSRHNVVTERDGEKGQESLRAREEKKEKHEEREKEVNRERERGGSGPMC